ncbi:MAG: NAD(P)-dependent oxidoreductase [Patescibacteria group bacterium]
MKIAFFEVETWEQIYLQKKLADHTLIFHPEPLTKENASQFADVDIVSIFITSHPTKEVLDKMPNLKLISTRSTGYDHIDVPFCRKKRVVVCYVPHYGTHTVAEHTFALILGLTRKIYASLQRTKQGQFDHHELTGMDISGKTLGILGLGDIGIAVSKIAKGFGMKVVAYARHPDEKLARKYGITFLTVNQLLGASDIVSIHLPYTKQTQHLINKRNIKRFKKGSLLINTARGGIVETEAILFGLEKGILGGAGLDVLEQEGIIEEEREILTERFQKRPDFETLYYNHLLMNNENVIVTPHNAFNSREALQMILDVTVQNILDFAEQKPQNMVA